MKISNKEPQIVIGGVTLTTGEAMTLRVALESFMMELNVEGLGDSAKAITAGYIACGASAWRHMRRSTEEQAKAERRDEDE